MHSLLISNMSSSSSMLFFFLFLLPLLLFQPCNSTTVLVDGVLEWSNPSVVVGDSIIFRHKNHYNLYIFQNQRAFQLCNFTQATLLTKPNSTQYTWHPSRPGVFYFTFNNGSRDGGCGGSQKMDVKVSAKATVGAPAPAAAAPDYPWPFQPHASPAAGSPVKLPDKAGGIPFINSNPAVPLPTGEVDTATIRPLTTSASAHLVTTMGLLPAETALFAIFYLLL